MKKNNGDLMTLHFITTYTIRLKLKPFDINSSDPFQDRKYENISKGPTNLRAKGSKTSGQQINGRGTIQISVRRKYDICAFKNRAVSKDKQTWVYEEIYVVVVVVVVVGVTNIVKIIKIEEVTSRSKIVVNSGRIIVDHCRNIFGDSYG